MSTDVAKAEEKKLSKFGTIRNMLQENRVEILAALPKHVDIDRMLRLSTSSARKNPELLNCTPESFIGAVIQSAQLGLEPDTPLGHAYLVPRRNKKTGNKEVQFMPGYRGYMDLVYRVPGHPILVPRAVYDADEFRYSLGLNPTCHHVPKGFRYDAKLTHAYVTASFPDGRHEFMVMNREEIEAVRARSSATGFSPWQTDYEAMAFKTVIRRFTKYLPMSAELQTAVGLDDALDAGTSQDNDAWKNKVIHTKGERIVDKMQGQPDDPADYENFDKKK